MNKVNEEVINNDYDNLVCSGELDDMLTSYKESGYFISSEMFENEELENKRNKSLVVKVKGKVIDITNRIKSRNS